MARPSRDEYFLRMAELVATRSTCARRQVGCVLVNSRNRVIGTGYNGVPMGMLHCNEHNQQCAGANAPSGMSLDACNAVHAEMNALLQCRDWEVAMCYCTASPCIHCLKALMNTSCWRIVFLEEYAHSQCKDLWLAQRPPFTPRVWEHYPKSW
jgi:dCMP deaminase